MQVEIQMKSKGTIVDGEAVLWLGIMLELAWFRSFGFPCFQ